MRKRIMATVVALVLSVSVLAGCGGTSKKDYVNDIGEIVDMARDFSNISLFGDPEDVVKEIEDIVKDMKVKTPEGKALKNDLKDMADSMSKLAKDADNEKAAEKLSKAMEDFQDDMEDFLEAADAAGVDEDDIDEKDLEFLGQF